MTKEELWRVAKKQACDFETKVNILAKTEQTNKCKSGLEIQVKRIPLLEI